MENGIKVDHFSIQDVMMETIKMEMDATQIAGLNQDGFAKTLQIHLDKLHIALDAILMALKIQESNAIQVFSVQALV